MFAVLDGTHVPVLAPKNDDASFRNRKGWTSINAMVATDSRHKFIFVDSKAPGSAHDCRVMKNTSMYDKYHIQKRLPFDGGIVGADGGYNDYIPWICTPYPDKRNFQDPMEPRISRFNTHFLRARTTVEQTIGMIVFHLLVPFFNLFKI